MPAHHEIEETIDEYLSKVSIEDEQPLFQRVNKGFIEGAIEFVVGWGQSKVLLDQL